MFIIVAFLPKFTQCSKYTIEEFATISEASILKFNCGLYSECNQPEKIEANPSEIYPCCQGRLCVERYENENFNKIKELHHKIYEILSDSKSIPCMDKDNYQQIATEVTINKSNAVDHYNSIIYKKHVINKPCNTLIIRTVNLYKLLGNETARSKDFTVQHGKHANDCEYVIFKFTNLNYKGSYYDIQIIIDDPKCLDALYTVA